MALTTVQACKAFRGIPGDNQEHDDELARLIPAVQGFLQEACERKFDQATYTEYYSGGAGGRDLIIVANPPLVTITNVWDDPLRAYATALAATSYSSLGRDATAGIIRLDGLTFHAGLNNIKVTYSGGFAVIPTDLEQAAIELVWAAREKGVNNLVGVRSRSVADGNVQYVNLGWGSLVQDIVEKYNLHTGVA